MKEYSFNKFKEKVYKLDCGLEIHHFPYEDYHTVHMGFVIPHGSNMSSYKINDKRIKTGIAHFLEHRMFDSEKGDLSFEFAKMGAFCNAYTYFDRTCYYFSTTYDPYEPFKLLYELVTNFYSTKEKIENEKSIIIQEMREGISHPATEISHKMNYRMFTNSTFKYPIIGLEKDIKNTTLEDLQNAFNAFYRLDNMYLVIAGPVDIDEIINYIYAHPTSNELKVKLEKIDEREDYSNKKYAPVYLYRDIVEKIQGINLKIDVKPLIEKYGRYQYELIMEAALSLIFDLGSPFIEEFNRLDVGYNSFNYQYVDVDGNGLLSIKYLSEHSKKNNEFILSCLKDPSKYISPRAIELYEKKVFGKKLILLQDMYSTFQEVTINISNSFNYLELFSETKKISINDIIYFINYIGKGIILKGILIPLEKKTVKNNVK